MRVTQRFNTVFVRLCTEAFRMLSFPLRFLTRPYVSIRHLHTAKRQYHLTSQRFTDFIAFCLSWSRLVRGNQKLCNGILMVAAGHDLRIYKLSTNRYLTFCQSSQVDILKSGNVVPKSFHFYARWNECVFKSISPGWGVVWYFCFDRGWQMFFLASSVSLVS